LETAWRQAAGPLAAVHPGGINPPRRARVIVANSTLVQELGYQKAGILAALQQLLPDQGINASASVRET